MTRILYSVKQILISCEGLKPTTTSSTTTTTTVKPTTTIKPAHSTAKPTAATINSTTLTLSTSGVVMETTVPRKVHVVMNAVNIKVKGTPQGEKYQLIAGQYSVELHVHNSLAFP